MGGIAQCIAEMIAAQIVNERSNNVIPIIYGAVTIGTNWQFLTLQGTQVNLDTTEYFISDVEKLLGILHYAISSQMEFVNGAIILEQSPTFFEGRAICYYSGT